MPLDDNFAEIYPVQKEVKYFEDKGAKVVGGFTYHHKPNVEYSYDVIEQKIGKQGTFWYSSYYLTITSVVDGCAEVIFSGKAIIKGNKSNAGIYDFSKLKA